MDAPTPFQWALAHLQHLGWGAILSAVVWVFWKFLPSFKERSEKGMKAMEQIDQMATNHFPHMENDLKELNQKTTEGNKILSEIAQGIAVLVDRKDR